MPPPVTGVCPRHRSPVNALGAHSRRAERTFLPGRQREAATGAITLEVREFCARAPRQDQAERA
ncbi:MULTISPECIES: hypothetical protein [unclassified Cryobacterium]|uniref:hypothetical protein n=1 Tax=unclassified Cryobacterium TaxID=2649013 RepID=UPI002AB592B9|nr:MULTISPECIES: hypothetical protein [Cryobacterium]MDY7526426.1 hypothetical protein [Cryobacterium sp. 10C2]MDY7557768.1 hypothetical protein [Cryobacterium sp. 10C3]MEB0003359.1 hypothetical protein [Cryobacterium sp. RTC2.1]MEB0202857.1 hypothetical protein [Cryobacterium sp. 5I3]MEB0288313.1 hypothetical protein [Cryobacterium sp. 10S3]